MHTLSRKERFMRVLRGEPTDRAPVFPLLMSFAARYHGISYREFAGYAHALAESQIHALEAFPLDAITACSDAFRVSADLGGEVVWPDETPPFLASPLVKTAADLDRLAAPDPLARGSRMADRVAAVEEMCRSVGGDAMVLGWVDMPFAEACSLCGVQAFLLLLYDDPVLAHRILRFLCGIVSSFALAQLEAGAPMIGAGDAAASLISPAQYREFVLPYEQEVTNAVHGAGGYVKLHICGNTGKLLSDMARAGCDLYNVDHLVDFDEAARVYASVGKAFKGNVNPVLLTTEPPSVCAELARTCLDKAARLPYMLSCGCEVPASVPMASFRAFCEA